MQNRYFNEYLELGQPLLPYDRAAYGDVDFIKLYLMKFPDKINQPWNGTIQQLAYARSNRTWVEDIETWTMRAAAGIAIMNPGVGFFTTLGWAYCVGKYETSYINYRKGWTLLEFAAETGQIAVATYLITHNADLNNNRFLQIAKDHNQHAFFMVCSKLVENAGNNLANKNKILEMIDVLESLKIELAVKEYELDEYSDVIGLFNGQINIYEDKISLLSDDDVADINNKNAYLSDEYKKNYVIKMQKFIDELKKKLDVLGIKANETCKEKIKQCEELLAEFKKLNNIVSSPSIPAKPSQSGIFSQTPIKKDKFQYPFGLRDKDIPFIYGDCFYHAVISNCPDKKWKKEELREAVKNEMLNNKEIYINSLICEDKDGQVTDEIMMVVDKTPVYTYQSYKNYEEFCNEMAKPQACVDSMEIRAFTSAMKICCVLVKQDEDKFHEEHIYGKEHYSDTTPPVFLGHESKERCHYVALECQKNKKWQEVWQDIEKSVTEKKNKSSGHSPKK